MYIRDFCTNLSGTDIDNYFEENELKEYNNNIILNKDFLNSSININTYKYYNAVSIIGSSKKDGKIDNFSNNLIIGINESIKEYSEIIKIYMNNNPYKKIVEYCNNVKEWPEGLFSFRTNPTFIKYYKGVCHGFNTPMTIKGNSLLRLNHYNMILEDHRSILLSALNLVYLLGIREINLINTENYLKEERAGSVYIKDGMYMFPQQIIDTSILSAATYWLNKFGIKTYTLDPNFDIIETIQVRGT
jgi:hypothetical protein